MKKKHSEKLNKKKQNNKVLKARAILEKNKAALESASKKRKEAEKRSVPLRVFHIVKNTVFGALIVAIALIVISFILVRINGGTPELFGYSIQRISSGSMRPALEVGDIILSKSVSSPEEIAVDDIITFKGGAEYDDRNITHRVIVPPIRNYDNEYVLTTKGDANSVADSEITFSDVNSKFVKKLDFLNDFFSFFLSPWGLIIFIAALIIIFFDELLTLVKVLTGNYTEDDDEEDDSIKAIAERIKAEEEEKARLEELRKERARKHDNTSAKKRKRRKKYHKHSK